MRHYRLDALHEQGGRLYLQGEPFTGVAYEVQRDRVVANYRVTGGARCGQAEDWNPCRIRVLSHAITGVGPDEIDERHPEIGDYLGDTLFKGVGYVFDRDTGMLLEELDFDPAAGELSREWYQSGALLAERNLPRPDGGKECVTYNEKGQIISASIWPHRRRMREMGWSLTPELRLRTLDLQPGYPEGDLRRVTSEVDSMLGLWGKGVTDCTVAWLDGLHRLQHLALHSTAITATGLARFDVCIDLRELVTYTNEGFRDEDVRALLAHLPGCKWDRR